MNKNTYEKIVLAEGEMHVYDFGGIRLHAYQTKDPLADEVFVLEKAGRAVVLEPPCFFANNRDQSNCCCLLVDHMPHPTRMSTVTAAADGRLLIILPSPSVMLLTAASTP